jgi:hypothetical protein
MSRRDRDDRTEKRPAVIELHTNRGLTAGEAFLWRLLPAAVVSAAVHLFVAVLAFVLTLVVPTAEATPQRPQVDVAVEEQPEPTRQENLTETEQTIDSTVAALTIESGKLDETNIETNVTTTDPTGNANNDLSEKLDSAKLLGNLNDLSTLPGSDLTGLGAGTPGAGEKGSGIVNRSLEGRSAGARDLMLKSNGGNTESEAAVARGLLWLQRVQKKDGGWEFDSGDHPAAATGLGLLPFLAAGQNHKAPKEKDNKYRDVVAAAIAALLKMQKGDGSFSGNSYANAIATVALCEAFGLTGDKTLLLRPCQAAVDHIQKGQGADGSWGYRYGDTGDTSIVGWQVQALHSAKLCKDLKVKDDVLKKAMKFLDSVASKPRGSSVLCGFGYKEPGATPTLTAVGLLCRYYLNGWGPNSPGLRDGVQYLIKEHPPEAKEKYDIYYYYYATQVAHFREGEEWAQKWNPKMRDMLIGKQVKDKNKPNVDGSWDKDDSPWIGDKCGRLGTTAMALLTLEVYYRHLPLYNRGSGAMNDLDRK